MLVFCVLEDSFYRLIYNFTIKTSSRAQTKLQSENLEEGANNKLQPHRQGWQYGTVWCLGTERYASIFAKKYDTLVRYAFFVMVRVRYTLVRYAFFVMVRVAYVGTLFE